LAVAIVTPVALSPHTPLYIRRRKIDQSTPQTFHHPPSHIRFLFRGKNNKDLFTRLSLMIQSDTQCDKGLTAEGKPRKRRVGGGRPPKHGEDTRSIRVPLSVETEVISSIPELRAILDHWEEDCINNPDSSRHYYLKKALDEIRALGY
jgi:hypothetical protein